MTPAPSSDPFDPWGLAPGGPPPDPVKVRCGSWTCTVCGPRRVPPLAAQAARRARRARLATLRAFLGLELEAAAGAFLGPRRRFWRLVLAVGSALAGLGARRLAALSRLQKE